MNINDIAHLPDLEAVKDRFARFFIAGSGCWLRFGGHNKRGYGKLSVKNTDFLAHRLSYVFFNGPVPPGDYVLHRCDTPNCVNPSHLFLGDVHANNRDKIAKGRQARGERNNSKLTESQVRAIRRDTRIHADIALFYGVSEPTISMIRSGKKWAHVPFD